MSRKKIVQALDEKDLDNVLFLTALISLVVALGALPVSWMWSGKFAGMAALALCNWIALSRIIQGAMGSKPLKLVYGMMAKPLLLTLLLVLAMNGSLEITSFLSAINAFFVALFGYLAWMHWVRPAPENSSEKQADAYA